MKGYPRAFAGVLYTTLLALLVSGLLLAPTTLDLRFELSMPWRLAGSDRVLTAALHVGMSYLLLMLFGAVTQLHVRMGLRRRSNRFAGWSLISLLLVLSVSGVAVFYLGDETAMRYATGTHLLVGTLLPLILVIHVLVGRAVTKLRAH